MAMKDLIDNIKEDSAKQIEKIKSDRDKQISDIESNKNKQIQDYNEKLDSKLELEINRIKTETNSKIKIDSKTIMDQEIQSKLDNAFEAIKANIPKFKKDPIYEKMLNKIVDNSVKELGTGASVHVSKDDVEKIKAKKGIKVVEDKSINGGVIVISKDGLMEVDKTIDNILSDVYDEIAINLMKFIK